MATICRLCATLKKIDNFVSINDPSLNLPLKIKKCCQLSIPDDDSLPQNVCTECVRCVDECWKFVTKVHEAQESLAKIFHPDDFSPMDQSNNLAEKLKVNVTKLDIVREGDSGRVDDDDNDDNDDDDDNDDANVCMKLENFDESMSKIFHSDHISPMEQNKNLSEKLKVNVTKLDIIREDSGRDNDTTVCMKLENFDEAVYEIDEIHLENDNDYISDDEIGEEANEFQIETMESISESDVNQEQQVHAETIENENWHTYPWICFGCPVVVSTPQDLWNHYSKKHKDSGCLKYTCADCSKTLDKYYAFINHVKSRHRDYLLLGCDLCARTFKNVQELSDHRISVHLEENDGREGSVLCRICGKAFKNQNALQMHAYCHQPDDVKYKFACEVCDKKFGSKPNLKAHQKIHAGLKDFVCDQCGKGFVQKANLEEHLNTHINESPYACGECDKRFKTPARLTKHKQVHTDIKPYKCEDCGKDFREKDTLKVHSRIHTGAMPYECEYCGKRFRFKSVLSTHRHQHTGERPYSCLDCNHHFTNWPNYNKHMKRRHGINTSSTARKPQTIPPTGMPSNAKQRYKVLKSSAADSASDLVTSTAEIPNLVSDDDIDTGTTSSTL